MGRPINKKYFANTNAPYQDQATGGPTGQGGEGVNVITVSNSGTLYSQGTTVAISAPQLPGGVAATISYSINASGNITVTKLTAGTGYTSASLTATKATTKNTTGDVTDTEFTLTNVASVSGIFVGMLASAPYGMPADAYVTSVGTSTVTLDKALTASSSTVALSFSDAGSSFASSISLTSSSQNGIAVTAFVPGGSSGVIGDIMKQEASRRYLVKTAQGQGQCILVTTSTLAAGEMYMTAVDVTGASYFVDKLTARRARLYRYLDNGGTFEVADGGVSGWSLDAATTGTVQIVNN
jgi:hypothetical protein